MNQIITYDVYQRVGAGTADVDVSKLPSDADAVSRLLTDHLHRRGDLQPDQVVLVTRLPGGVT